MSPYRTVIAALAALQFPSIGTPETMTITASDDRDRDISVDPSVIDFRYLMSGNCYAFTPATQAARDWARKDETMQALGRMNAAYVVEKQDFGTIVDLIDSAGFFFTKGA